MNVAETTEISWADATANFWMGCTKVSAACDHCYAERDWDYRRGKVTWGPHGDRVPVKAGELVVRKMQRHAAAFMAEHGHAPRIFVNSLSDWADNHKSIRPEWRARIFELARECPDVILMLLTKRPQNIARYLPADWGDGYPNVWLGTTAENQDEADRRIPHLLAVPAAIRFISAEPLLGPVDIVQWFHDSDCWLIAGSDDDRVCTCYELREFALDWVICGGESGPKARPMHPDWVRSLRDQCASAGVAFHLKQWGEWFPYISHPSETPGKFAMMARDKNGWTHTSAVYLDYYPRQFSQFGSVVLERIGKARAGRLLDGVKHGEFPA